MELDSLPRSHPEAGFPDAGESSDVAEGNGHRPEFSLPPVDRGKDAYLFLAACFTMEALVWGELSMTCNFPLQGH